MAIPKTSQLRTLMKQGFHALVSRAFRYLLAPGPAPGRIIGSATPSAQATPIKTRQPATLQPSKIVRFKFSKRPQQPQQQQQSALVESSSLSTSHESSIPTISKIFTAGSSPSNPNIKMPDQNTQKQQEQQSSPNQQKPVSLFKYQIITPPFYTPLPQVSLNGSAFDI